MRSLEDLFRKNWTFDKVIEGQRGIGKVGGKFLKAREVNLRKL